MLCMFGTTYLCEQVFSGMNFNKTKLHSKLTHKHLNDTLKLAATQDMVPDIEALVQTKRCKRSKNKAGLNPVKCHLKQYFHNEKHKYKVSSYYYSLVGNNIICYTSHVYVFFQLNAH